MGLRPTRANENLASSSPRKRGPIVSPMDSRFRGNDVIFGGAGPLFLHLVLDKPRDL
jgi:hypothetical protein